jgi:hypothetical protein
MRRRLRLRIGLEAALALCGLARAVLTAMTPEWIEALTGVEPDAGSGALEWAIVVGCVLSSIVLTVRAGHNTRLLQAGPAPGTTRAR